MTRFIAFVSGKGGVGKTTTTLNTSLALNNLGLKTIVLDANLATPNVALNLGILNPENHLNHFLRKKKNFQEVINEHHSGLSFIPASISQSEYHPLDHQKLTEIFEHLDNQADFVLIDSPSGLGQEVNKVLENSDETIIVVNPNLSSVIDALKTIRLAKENNNIITGIILNMTNKGKHELKEKEVQELLGYPILANVRNHKKFKKSLQQEAPLYHIYPRSKEAKQFERLANFLTLQND